ncbi:hypothetical protein ACBH85_004563 [Klebsiella pneumoniae]|nr:hypothetical protein [Klebsiella pneumoniae]ELP0880776.1 hypothetical protein [Klebsiella pneumoniae]
MFKRTSKQPVGYLPSPRVKRRNNHFAYMPSPKVERISDKRTPQKKNHQERITTAERAIEGNPVEKNSLGYTFTIETIEKVRRNLGRYPEPFGKVIYRFGKVALREFWGIGNKAFREKKFGRLEREEIWAFRCLCK